MMQFKMETDLCLKPFFKLQCKLHFYKMFKNIFHFLTTSAV